jgi:hypothetical protein
VLSGVLEQRMLEWCQRLSIVLKGLGAQVADA